MDSSLFELNTDRLRLIAATAETVNAEMNDPSRLSRLLRADVPKNWPPDLTEDVLASTALKLTADPANAGWYSWYMVLAKEPPEKSVVIGICSFKGRPKRHGVAEIGYSVLYQHRKNGYATEAVSRLLRWVFAQDGVRKVIAETYPDLRASVRVMEKNGFLSAGPGSEEGVVRYSKSPTRDSI